MCFKPQGSNRKQDIRLGFGDCYTAFESRQQSYDKDSCHKRVILLISSYFMIAIL